LLKTVNLRVKVSAKKTRERLSQNNKLIFTDMNILKFTHILLLTIILARGADASERNYSSSSKVDIDNDGVEETIRYSLNKAAEYYEGRLIIESKDMIQWDHQFNMTHNDLFDDLLMNEGNITVEHWVNHFFDGTLVYGAKYERYKIPANEIDMDYLDFYSKKENIPASELKNQILSQDINSTFYYRASWREELVMLVYLPELGKFISYSGGEY